MLFNSFPFAIFFIVVSLLYFMLPHRWRWGMLLLASCYFYMFFKPEFILILAFTIVIDYYAGILLENEPDQRKKKRYLVMSLIANIGILAVFKYYNFINGNITGLAELFGMNNPIPYLDMILPIGLSFHTFQAMSYTIEVYRGHQKAERHFGIYALYVMFYPQLVAGPIERPQNLLHQFHAKHEFNYANFSSGMRLILWGLFKKCVIADRLAIVTDPIFNNPDAYSGTALLMGSVFFSFQIFCDFSGYSDIAIGTARTMGFHLMRNFNRPYSSRSVDEFWTRWHISLSTWFKDYLYIPLGGNRVSPQRKYINLIIVFMVSGLWHGAAWTFIIWGALHALFVVVGGITRNTQRKLMEATGIAKVKWLDSGINRGITFFLVSVAWVFFRADSVQQALKILTKMWNVFPESVLLLKNYRLYIRDYLPNVPLIPVFWGVVCVLFMECVHVLQGSQSPNVFISRQPAYVRWGIYYFFAFCVLYFGIFEQRNFIYFQF